jgi:DNA-binding PadR family transcriptional regulator
MFLGVDDAAPLDPVRIQKGMFLLAKRGPARDVYDFEPYNWGPFSSEIYRDLDALGADGLVRSEPVPGRTWRLYGVTTAGAQRVRELIEEADPQAVEWLGQARRFVTERSFVALLREVYAAYPEYATNSMLR